MSSKKIFAANWKLNKTPKESAQFISELKTLISGDKNFFENKEILFFHRLFL